MKPLKQGAFFIRPSQSQTEELLELILKEAMEKFEKEFGALPQCVTN